MPPPPASDNKETAIRNYEAFCIAALMVLVLTLLQRGYGGWCLLPLCVGLLGIFGRMRIAPAGLLVALLVQLILDQALQGGSPLPLFDMGDMLECSAVLGFVGAHYRLQGLVHTLVPADPREKYLRRAAGTPETSGARRAVPTGEIVGLLVSAAAWAVAASFVWSWLPDDWNEFWRLPSHIWRVIILTWIVGLLILIGAAGFRHFGWEGMTQTEANLFLQDVLWREIRGEQRRAQRWLAWARLRYERRRTQTSPRNEHPKESS